MTEPFFAFRGLLAGAEGIELSLAVLETAVLPLNDTPTNISGAHSRNRTADLLLTMELLCQLS